MGPEQWALLWFTLSVALAYCSAWVPCTYNLMVVHSWAISSLISQIPLSWWVLVPPLHCALSMTVLHLKPNGGGHTDKKSNRGFALLTWGHSCSSHKVSPQSFRFLQASTNHFAFVELSWGWGLGKQNKEKQLQAVSPYCLKERNSLSCFWVRIRELLEFSICGPS